MKVLLVSTSPRIKGNTYTALSEAAKNLEGIQTMCTMVRNMAWMLKKFHGVETTPTPIQELPWQPMNFIR